MKPLGSLPGSTQLQSQNQPTTANGMARLWHPATWTAQRPERPSLDCRMQTFYPGRRDGQLQLPHSCSPTSGLLLNRNSDVETTGNSANLESLSYGWLSYSFVKNQ